MVEVNNKQEQIEFRFSRHGKYGDERWLEDQEDNRIYGIDLF